MLVGGSALRHARGVTRQARRRDLQAARMEAAHQDAAARMAGADAELARLRASVQIREKQLQEAEQEK